MAFTDEAAYPFWSPDSRFIGFFAQGKLKKIAAGGGPAQSLCDVTGGYGGSWNRDGVIVFGTTVQWDFHPADLGGWRRSHGRDQDQGRSKFPRLPSRRPPFPVRVQRSGRKSRHLGQFTRRSGERASFTGCIWCGVRSLHARGAYGSCSFYPRENFDVCALRSAKRANFG